MQSLVGSSRSGSVVNPLDHIESQSSLTGVQSSSEENLLFEEHLCGLQTLEQTLNDLKRGVDSMEQERDTSLVQAGKKLSDTVNQTSLLKANLEGIQHYFSLMAEKDERFVVLCETREALATEARDFAAQLQTKMVACEASKGHLAELKNQLKEVQDFVESKAAYLKDITIDDFDELDVEGTKMLISEIESWSFSLQSVKAKAKQFNQTNSISRPGKDYNQGPLVPCWLN